MDVERTFSKGSASYEADDFPEAMATLLPLADSGHAAAQYIVGQMYRSGNEVEASRELSLQYWKAAADQGHPDAALQLFFLLSPSTSDPRVAGSSEKDATGAEHYINIALHGFKKLAEAGDAAGMGNLGFLFQFGFGVPVDNAEAIRWYTAGFDAGGHGLANHLALLYYGGDTQIRDKIKARFWYMKAKEFNCQCVGIKEFESPERDAGEGTRKPPSK